MVSKFQTVAIRLGGQAMPHKLSCGYLVIGIVIHIATMESVFSNQMVSCRTHQGVHDPTYLIRLLSLAAKRIFTHALIHY